MGAPEGALRWGHQRGLGLRALPRSTRVPQRIPCDSCPLRPLPLFRAFEKSELEFVNKFKRGELLVDRGSTVLVEGSHSAHLFTALSGWGFRFKLLPDGRRQILNYVLPGDMLGLQSALVGEMEHSIEALTEMRLCVFERDNLPELYRNHPGLAFDITWIAAREEQMLDENLLSIGRRTAIERAAYLLAFLHARAGTVAVALPRSSVLPIRQQHVADTLGLSLVHTNKTLRKLSLRKLIAWGEQGCKVLEPEALAGIAHWEGLPKQKRPLV
ncbi:MAG TPA: Crp/Fnr family transcriptional regulator [Mesorhizobium sp.]